MKDPIERADAIKAAEKLLEAEHGIWERVVIEDAVTALCGYLMDLPSAQPDPSAYSDKLWHNAYEIGKAEAQPQSGRWIKSDTDGFVCSVCHNGYKTQPTLMGMPMFEFCPCCGADMRGKQDEQTD